MELEIVPVNYKNFDAQIAIISAIGRFGTTPITIVGYEQCKAELIRTTDNFVLYIEGVFDISKTGSGIAVVLEGKPYTLKTSDAIVKSFTGDVLAGISRTQTFDLHQILSNDFVEDRYAKFRCFFPTNPENVKSFCFLFETLHYENDHTRFGFDCVRLKIGDKRYDITQVKNEEDGYYIVETLDDNSYSAFKKDCFAIQQAMGFLAGYMPGGEQYVFTGDIFEYSRHVRPALKSFYNPITSNPYSKLYQDNEAAEPFEGRLTKISSDVFSNLVNLIKENDDISSACILLMEAASVKSLLLIPSVFAVIIESLAKHISKPGTGNYLPIPDNSARKQIIGELIAVIDSHSGALSDDGVLTLKRRILGINNPVVKAKLTNNEKLTAPFEQLGIALSLEDIMAIEHRNDLLHGNISLDSGDARSDKLANNYILHIMDRLYTLISKLLLKSAGYNGFVINYPKFSEAAAGIKTNEAHFVEI